MPSFSKTRVPPRTKVAPPFEIGVSVVMMVASSRLSLALPLTSALTEYVFLKEVLTGYVLTTFVVLPYFAMNFLCEIALFAPPLMTPVPSKAKEKMATKTFILMV